MATQRPQAMSKCAVPVLDFPGHRRLKSLLKTALFLDPMIDSWDIDLKTFGMGVV